MKWSIRLSLILLFFVTMNGCSSDDSSSCPKNPDDASKYVIVGFWKTKDCSGDPIQTNAFPVDNSAGCYCWPGNSGKNSAKAFSCDAKANSFTYTQFTNLTCEPNSTSSGRVKTSYTDKCVQDYPPVLYAKITNFSACKK